ncbi:MAG: hypothetical protein OEV06_00785 [Anaerolineae bacterium]|nr:hypothetical protein [Anaerolineae bacterium]
MSNEFESKWEALSGLADSLWREKAVPVKSPSPSLASLDNPLPGRGRASLGGFNVPTQSMGTRE